MKLHGECESLREQVKVLESREKALRARLEYGRIHIIEVNRICANPAQPRKQFEDTAIMRLADSLRQYGMLQPLSVRRIMDESQLEGGLFQLVAGERRLRAAVMIGMTHVPCLIINADSKKSAELAIIENIQRENLNMFEQAKAFEKLIAEYGLTQSEVAERLSTSQSCVANKLRLMKLGDDEQHFIIENGLTERHARALLRITDIPLRKAAMMAIADKKLNVSSAESYIERLVGTLNCPKPENGSGVAADSQKAAQLSVCDGLITDSDGNDTTNGSLTASEDNIPTQCDVLEENADHCAENGGPVVCASDIPDGSGNNNDVGLTYTTILPANDYKKKLSGAFGRIFGQLPVETSVSAENDDKIVFTVTVRKSKMA